jgi:hypothetical protein
LAICSGVIASRVKRRGGRGRFGVALGDQPARVLATLATNDIDAVRPQPDRLREARIVSHAAPEGRQTHAERVGCDARPLNDPGFPG